MRCYKKSSSLACRLALLLLTCLCTFAAQADGITVVKTESHIGDEGYKLSANFNIILPPSVAEALKKGVVLNFISELAITRSRWYWLDLVVLQEEQQTKLSYNALTQQYRISRGSLFQGFASLESALRLIGHQTSSPVPASELGNNSGYVSKLLKGEIKYTAYAQMRLDTSLLPKPLQVNALTNSDWNLESEKYSWPVQAEQQGSETGSTP